MRESGLFVSRAIKYDVPPVFNEPAGFLIRPDGTIYHEATLSMPIGRLRIDDVLAATHLWTAHGYPARGGH